MLRKAMFGILALALLGGVSLAQDIKQLQDAEYTSNRTIGSGVTAGTAWSDGFRINWSVSGKDGQGYYTYSYTFDDGATTPADITLDEWIVEVSSELTELSTFQFTDGGAVTSGTGQNVFLGTHTATGSGESIYGVKFTYDAASYSFKTLQDPVYGDFWATDSATTANSAVWNTGIGVDLAPGPGSTTNWVATVDTESGIIIPEPSLSVLALTALLAGAVARRRKKEGED